ncbi:MAG: RimK/LysX family protein [Pseudomonadales bacterium]
MASITSNRLIGGRGGLVRPLLFCLGMASGLTGCMLQPAPVAVEPVIDPGISGDLTDMQIRIQMLQSELNGLRESMRDRGAREAAAADSLEARLATVQERIEALPAELVSMCPEMPASATVTTQCEGTGEIQRVVVSGDKLVVGQFERVSIDPPDATIVARIDPASETSALAADEIVEFERDGNRWVRFNVVIDGQPATVERPIKRTARVTLAQGGSARRPVVDLRLQLGDVRETVDFALSDRLGDDHGMVLGRNFLTDVALIDIGARFVQPAIGPQAN